MNVRILEWQTGLVKKAVKEPKRAIISFEHPENGFAI